MHRRSLIRLFAGVSVGALSGFRHPPKAPRRIAVVGGGIIGASIAYQLARRGAQVTLCERERPAAGATANSFAWINAYASKEPDHYHRLNRLSTLAWRHVEREVGEGLAVQWGGSLEWRTDPEAARALIEQTRRQQARGYPIQLVDEDELADLEPEVRPGSPIGAAAWATEEGSVDPVAATSALLGAAKSAGAEVLYPCDVTDFDLRSGRLRGLTTSEGPLEADAVVIAAGVGTPALAAKAGLNVPLRDAPGVLAHTAPGDRLLNRVVMAPGGAFKQKLDGRVVISAGFSGDPNVDEREATARAALERARSVVPGLARFPFERATLGYRPLPADGHPVLGFAAYAPDVYLAVMHSGITLSALVGRLAATELLDDVRVEMLEPYRVERFQADAGSVPGPEVRAPALLR